MWCLAAELWEGASSTKPFVCPGCANELTRVPGRVPASSVVEKCFLTVTWRMKQLTAPGTGRGDKNNCRLKINTATITLGTQTHRRTHIFVRKRHRAVTHNAWEHATLADHVWVPFLRHYGCWFCGSSETLMLKSPFQDNFRRSCIPQWKKTILHAPINSHLIYWSFRVRHNYHMMHNSEHVLNICFTWCNQSRCN